MPSAMVGQQLSGPFSEKSLPSYQAAQQVFQSWQHFLSRNQINFLQCVIDRTVRFGKRWRFIAKDWFFEGHDPRDATGYAGCTPLLPMSDKSFYAIRAELQRLGILRVRRGVYVVNYAITALHLAADEAVQRRVLHENKRGGMLSTVEGIIEWASLHVQRLLSSQDCVPARQSSNNSCQKSRHDKRSNGGNASRGNQTPQCSPSRNGDTCGKAQENKGSPYTFHYKNYGISSDKSSDNLRGNFIHQIRTWFMERRSPAEILSAVEAVAASKAEKVSAKRRKRRSLPDMCALFEKSWAEGQRERSDFAPPSRILGRYRKLVKDQIIKPSLDTQLDIEDFAKWCAVNWDAIGSQYFTRTKNYPDNPTIAWLIATLEVYTTAYEAKDYLRTRNVTRKELEARAQTTEIAAASAEEAQRRIDRMRVEHDKELRELRRQLREAQRGSLQSTASNPFEKVDFSKFDKLFDEPQPKRKLRRKRK